MLVDTDVLIDYLRGNVRAVSFLEKNINFVFISSITVAELYQGVRKGEERVALDNMTEAMSVLSLTEEVAKEAGLLRQQYKDSHGCGLADCLIAATAKLYRLPLKTLNTKHYPMLSDVEAPYKKR